MLYCMMLYSIQNCNRFNRFWNGAAFLFNICSIPLNNTVFTWKMQCAVKEMPFSARSAAFRSSHSQWQISGSSEAIRIWQTIIGNAAMGMGQHLPYLGASIHLFISYFRVPFEKCGWVLNAFVENSHMISYDTEENDFKSTCTKILRVTKRASWTSIPMIPIGFKAVVNTLYLWYP